VTGPFLVDGRQEANPLLFLTDRQNKLYILSASGHIIAKRQLTGQLLGGVSYLDDPGTLFKYLFNTPGHLYLVDSAGNDAPGYPYRLEKEAAAGLLLLPNAIPSKSLVIIPAADLAIYAYDLTPGVSGEWKNPSLSSMPAAVPSYFHEKKNDYILFRDSEGGILITDGKGKEKKRFQASAADARHSAIYANRTNSKGMFITTDRRGHLVYFPESGKMQETVFGEFSPDHYFLYTEFDGKDGDDFVIFDDRTLQVFDRFKKNMLKVSLPEPPASMPIIFSSSSKARSFLYAGTSGIVYLIDNQGNVFFDESITTSLPLVILRNEPSGNFSAITAKDNCLYLSPLP
jgi:hypothetical protein